MINNGIIFQQFSCVSLHYIIALGKSKVNNYLLIYDKFLLNNDIYKIENGMVFTTYFQYQSIFV